MSSGTKDKGKNPKMAGNRRYSQIRSFCKRLALFFKRNTGLLEKAQNETLSKQFSVQLLQLFYIMPYETEQDFYSQFYLRLKEMKKRFL